MFFLTCNGRKTCSETANVFDRYKSTDLAGLHLEALETKIETVSGIRKDFFLFPVGTVLWVYTYETDIFSSPS